MFSQQKIAYTQYMFAPHVFNPALAGNTDFMNINGFFKSDMAGFKDYNGDQFKAQSFFLNADLPIEALAGGVGLVIENNSIGVFRETDFKLSYAYKMALGTDKLLSFGLQVGFMNTYLDYSKFKPGAEGDPLIGGGSGEQSSFDFDFGVGAFFRIHKKFYVGVSAMQLLAPAVDIGDVGELKNYKFARQFYVQAGGEITFKRAKSLKYMPSLQAGFDGRQFVCDVTNLLMVKNIFWFGVNVRAGSNNFVGFLTGFEIKNIQIGYAFDVPMTRMGTSGSHEIMLGYKFKIVKDRLPKSYRNTRFL